MFFKVKKVGIPKNGKAYMEIAPSTDHFKVYFVNDKNETYRLEVKRLDIALSLASNMNLPVEFSYED